MIDAAKKGDKEAVFDCFDSITQSNIRDLESFSGSEPFPDPVKGIDKAIPDVTTLEILDQTARMSVNINGKREVYHFIIEKGEWKVNLRELGIMAELHRNLRE